ncbi:phage virion structural protein [Salmonella phage SPFM20]|nr:phage virion structural protein [Salmonella phage SPFM8]VFR14911.1 phage virion structural protein [Salmonella phage SPFM20]
MFNYYGYPHIDSLRRKLTWYGNFIPIAEDQLVPIAPQLLPHLTVSMFNPDMMPQPGSVAADLNWQCIGARFDDPLYMEMFTGQMANVDNTKPQLNDDTTITLGNITRFWTACVCWPMNDNGNSIQRRIDYQSRMYGFKYDVGVWLEYMSGIKMGKFKPKMHQYSMSMSLNNPYGNPIMRMTEEGLMREQWGMVDSTHEINMSTQMLSLSGMPDQSVDNWMLGTPFMKDIMFDNLQAFIPLPDFELGFSDSPMEDGRRKNRSNMASQPKSSLDYSILAALDLITRPDFNLCFDNIANSRKMFNHMMASNPTPVNREYGGLTFRLTLGLGLAAQRVTNPYMGYAKPTTAYNVNDELSGWNDRNPNNIDAVPSVADYFDRRLSETDKNDPGYDPNTDYDNSYQNVSNVFSAIFN